METGFVALFMMIGVSAVASQIVEKQKTARLTTLLLAISGLGLYLSRPDALLYTIVIMAFYAVIALRQKLLMSAVIASSVIFFAVLMHIAFRVSYYGNILPNTAVLKLANFPLHWRISGGLGYIIPFLRNVFPIVILAMFSVFLKRHSIKYLTLCLFFASVIYQIYVGGDPWNYRRIMSPVIPLIVILAADAAFRLSHIFFYRCSHRMAMLFASTSR